MGWAESLEAQWRAAEEAEEKRLKEEAARIKYLREVNPGFWNVRVPLKKLGGAFDVSHLLVFFP